MKLLAIHTQSPYIQVKLIVCTPGGALRAFIASQLDYLATGPFLISLEHTL